MATRKRTSSNAGFSAESAPKVVEVTEPSTKEELQEEMESVEIFLNEVVEETLKEQELKETPSDPLPPPPAPVSTNPPPNTKGLIRPRRNIPRFVR